MRNYSGKARVLRTSREGLARTKQGRAQTGQISEGKKRNG